MDVAGYRSTFCQKLDKNECETLESEYKKKEWRTAVYGLVISVSIIATKIIYGKRDGIYTMFWERQLMTKFGENGMTSYFWTDAFRFNINIWTPLICGVAMTAFTWIMVYLDSSVPGVQPPTPLSPTKYKVRSRHTFHMGYVMAIVNGLLVATLLFINGISL